MNDPSNEITDDCPDLIPEDTLHDPVIASEPTSPSKPKIPVTIISGYLGSGKTTLVQRILTEHHGKRIAVILNEFGESGGIEKHVSKTENTTLFTEWLELSNGCLCCSVKDAGVKAIEELIEQQQGKFDYVLLEMSGMGDPGEIATLFWIDAELESRLCLDAVVTVVDAKFTLERIKDASTGAQGINEATRQIALADRIIINKIDLVSEEELVDLERVIRHINAIAPIIKTERSKAPLDFILDTDSFASRLVHSDEKKMEDLTMRYKGQGHQVDTTVQTLVIPLSSARIPETECHHDHDHEHTDNCTSSARQVVDICPLKSLETMDKFLQSVLWASAYITTTSNNSGGAVDDRPVYLRTKGLFSVQSSKNDGELEWYVVQGVREMFEFQRVPNERGIERGDEKIVFIGRSLDGGELRQRLEKEVRNSCTL